MNNYFGELTSRMRQFREELLSVQPQMCVERALITTKVYRENQDQPLAIKRALMLKEVLEQMSIYIEPQTMIGGGISAQPVFIASIRRQLQELYRHCVYAVSQAEVVACVFRNDANLIGALQCFLENT